MFVTKYANKCKACGVSVSEGQGFCYKDADGWSVVCPNAQCVKDVCPEHFDKYKQLLKTIIPEEKEISYSLDINKFVKRAKEKGAYPYQIEAIKWLLSDKNKLLADDMGLGKSLISLMSIDETKGTFIVCPSHLKLNWRDEAKKWRPDLKVTILKNKKEFKYPEPGEVVIFTYGLLPWWLELPPRKRKNEMVLQEEHDICKNIMIIFDEVHALKNNKSQQTRKAKFLSRMCFKTIGLTGTPIMNKQLEFWNICSAIGIEKDIFGDFTKFLYLFKGRKGNFGYEFEKLPRDNVWDYLSNSVMRRTKEEVNLQLPDKIIKEVYLDGNKKQQKQWEDMWSLFKRSGYFEKGELPPIEEMSKEKRDLAVSKIPLLKSVVQELVDNGIAPIVFSAHLEPVKELSKLKGWGKIDGSMTANQKHKVAQDFQSGKLNGLACTIKAAGTGFTLTRSSYVIFNDLDWVPANNNQASDRINRIGQKADKIFYYYLIADHELDKHIHKLIIQKMQLAKKTLSKTERKKIDLESALTDNKESQEERKKQSKVDEKKMAQSAILELVPRWLEVYKGKKPRSSIEDHVTFNSEPKTREDRILNLLYFSGLESKEEKMLAESLLQKKLDENA